MEKYERAEMEVVEFTADIITTSTNSLMEAILGDEDGDGAPEIGIKPSTN